MQIIQSDDPQDIIGLFVAPKYDRHCQAYREASWLADEKVANAKRWATVETCFDELLAAYYRRKAS